MSICACVWACVRVCCSTFPLGKKLSYNRSLILQQPSNREKLEKILRKKDMLVLCLSLEFLFLNLILLIRKLLFYWCAQRKAISQTVILSFCKYLFVVITFFYCLVFVLPK